MNIEEIPQILKNNLADYMGAIPTDFKDSDSLEDLGADSVDRVEMAMYFERIFDIELTDAEVEKMITIQDMIDIVTNSVTIKKQNT